MNPKKLIFVFISEIQETGDYLLPTSTDSCFISPGNVAKLHFFIYEGETVKS